MKEIVAVFGHIASGKDLVSDLLIQRGYVHLDYRDRLVDEIVAQGLPLERTVFQSTAERLRAEHGTDVQARALAELIGKSSQDRFVLNGFRHPDDLLYVREHLSAFTVGITVPFEERFRRMRSRNRLSDPITIEEFEVVDLRDRENMEACLGMVDALIPNTSTREALDQRLTAVMAKALTR